MHIPRLISRSPSVDPAPDFLPPRRIHPAKRLLLDAGNDFLADCHARNLSPRTIEQYEWSIRSFEASLPTRVLAALTAKAARTWSTKLSATRRPTSVRSAVRAMKVFSAWLSREGYAATDPLSSVRLPRAPDPLILPMSAGQVTALMRVSSPLLRAAIALGRPRPSLVRALRATRCGCARALPARHRKG